MKNQLKLKHFTVVWLGILGTASFANNLDFSLPDGYEVIDSKHTRPALFDNGITGLVHRVRFRVQGSGQIQYLNVRLGNYQNVSLEEPRGSLTSAGFVWVGASDRLLPSGGTFSGYINTQAGEDKLGRKSGSLKLGNSYAAVQVTLARVDDPLRRCEEIATRIHRNLAAQLRIIGSDESERVVRR
jgi:hypothetical protein